jgi:hypothetical protein
VRFGRAKRARYKARKARRRDAWRAIAPCTGPHLKRVLCYGHCTCRTAYRYIRDALATRYPAHAFSALVPFQIAEAGRDIEVRAHYVAHGAIHYTRVSGVVSI